MNNPIIPISLARLASIVATLCAGFLISTAPAQPVTTLVSSRILLVFDTSSSMKKREPATQYAIQRLFFAMMNGQLRQGDSIGVWAFDRELRAGDFPLINWLPQNAAEISSHITDFVGRQHYSKSTRFGAIMPDVNNLVRSSERLTVLIFCDGEDQIKGTPFDDAINHLFKQNELAFKNENQAFIVVLRSQFGSYTGYSVNSSSVGVNFPAFPPLPAPPQPAPLPKTNLPPAQVASNLPPPVRMPPLVIVGTNVSTNLIPATPPQTVSSNALPTKAISNPPSQPESNPPPTAVTSSSSTNASQPPLAKIHTNAPVAPEGNPSGLSRSGALAIGAALLVVAVVFIIFALIRSRQTSRGSLISRSMNKK